MTPSGWDHSAEAWLDEIGEAGDWARRYVLDGVMLDRVRAGKFVRALDVGCGEGRFCRMLAAEGIGATGIDPTIALIEAARRRDPAGDYRVGVGEDLPFADWAYDLVISYLSLIDIADFRRAIGEMTRVLAPGGSLLIANLASFNTAASQGGWLRDEAGELTLFPIDHYLEESPEEVRWRDMAIINWHRPLAAYMQALLGAGLTLTFFDEPAPADFPAADEDKADRYRRVPYFLVMEWRKNPRGDANVP